MEHDTRYELVVAIVDRGCSHSAVIAAKAAGALSCTVLDSAHKAGTVIATLLGAPVHLCKDVVVFLTAREDCDRVMEAVQNASIKTTRMVFALPANTAAELMPAI